MPRYKLPTLGKFTRSKVSTLSELNWHVALACNGGECIRVAPQANKIIIGDSKNPGGPVLTYSRTEWYTFVDGIRQGDFDGL
jgi:predicted secreted Zn-dependent protease